MPSERIEPLNNPARVCCSCGEPGVPIGADRCRRCGEEQIEPFRAGWDESD